MDTEKGQLIQVVDTEAEKSALEAASITAKVMTQAEVTAENVKREEDGKGKIEQVARQPKKNCRHCQGRGYMGKNLITGRYVPCYCVEDPETEKARVYQQDMARRFGRK
jgi:hypothetical protein